MYKGAVSFTPWLLYSQGNSPHFPLDRKLGGPQIWRRKYPAPARNRTLGIQLTAHCYTDRAIPANNMPYRCRYIQIYRYRLDIYRYGCHM
jgi:hypothetical protein